MLIVGQKEGRQALVSFAASDTKSLFGHFGFYSTGCSKKVAPYSFSPFSQQLFRILVNLIKFFNAKKLVGSRVKKSLSSSFFNRIKFCLAVRSRTIQVINV